MIILIVPLFLIIIVIRIFYSSSKTSYIKAKNYTPKFDYEIQAEMKRKVSEEKKEKEDYGILAITTTSNAQQLCLFPIPHQ